MQWFIQFTKVILSSILCQSFPPKTVKLPVKFVSTILSLHCVLNFFKILFNYYVDFRQQFMDVYFLYTLSCGLTRFEELNSADPDKMASKI